MNSKNEKILADEILRNLEEVEASPLVLIRMKARLSQILNAQESECINITDAWAYQCPACSAHIGIPVIDVVCKKCKQILNAQESEVRVVNVNPELKQVFRAHCCPQCNHVFEVEEKHYQPFNAQESECVHCKGTGKLYLSHTPVDCPACKKLNAQESELPADSGIPELDNLSEQYNRGEISLLALVDRVWNKAISLNAQESEDFNVDCPMCDTTFNVCMPVWDLPKHILKQIAIRKIEEYEKEHGLDIVISPTLLKVKRWLDKEEI